MKNKFLDELKNYLEQYDIKQEIIEDILQDHKDIIDDAVAAGKTEEEIVQKLGEPRSIARALRGEKKNRKKSNDSVIIALSPFIAVIAFMLLGMIWDMWATAWLVFLIIPVTAILTEVRRDGLVVLLTSLSPFIALTTFMILGFSYGYWQPGWMVFLIIPLIAYFNEKDLKKRSIDVASLVIASGLYLILIYQDVEYTRWAWIVFLLPLIAGIYTGNIKFRIDLHSGKKEVILLGVIIASIVTFIVVGLTTDLWGIMWLVFLTIPVTSILLYNNDKKSNIVAVTPFIAVTTFILLGMLADAWDVAWMVFFIIPMVAIISGRE